MPAPDTDYELLGLPRRATAAQARAAFHRIALRVHPDKNGGSQEADAEFKRVAAAYRAVRKDCCDAGEAGEAGEADAADADAADASACVRVMMGDALRAMLVWWLFASTSAADDVAVEIIVPLADACTARLKRLQIAVMRRPAPGWAELLKESQVLYVRADAACAAPGGRVHRFPGAGDDPVLPMGRRGDVVVTLRLASHPRLRPDTIYSCKDLHVDVAVTPRDHYYGRTARIDHVDGGDPVEAHFLGRSGRRVHVERGRGLSDPSGKRGDMYVFFELRMPEIDDAALADPSVRAAFDLIFVGRQEPEPGPEDHQGAESESEWSS